MIEGVKNPTIVHDDAAREVFGVEPMGIAVSAKDPRFYNLIDNYVDAIEATGILSALRAKWFEDDAWLDELP